MKQQINPAVAGIIVVIILAVVGLLVFKGTGGGGSKGPNEPANSSPFGPGGGASQDMMKSGAMAPGNKK